MNTINLKKGWIKISKRELNNIRVKIYTQYKNDGGIRDIKDFNSHLPNYDNLILFIEKKLENFQAENNTKILINGSEYKNISPGKTFLKHLFYLKKDEENPQFQRINIDLCYLYIYGQTRNQEVLKAVYDKERYEDEFEQEEKPKNILILSYTYNNLEDAQKVESFLTENFPVTVENDIRNSPIFKRGKIDDLYKGLKENDFVVLLLSRNYLQNEESVNNLIDFINEKTKIFITKTIIILLPDIYKGEYNIFSTLGKIALTVHWKLHIEKLEKAFTEVVEDKKDTYENSSIAKTISEKILKLKKIKKEIYDVLQQITNIQSAIRYDIFFHKIKSYNNLLQLMPKKDEIGSSVKFENIYKSINIPSNNNPKKPEFPPKPYYKPKFPASETFKIEINGFSDVWLKDESTNPTGTHKDRFAWEVVLKYRALLKSLSYKNPDKLPQISIISSGGAATAVQNLFNVFKIPTRLKVLVDKNLNGGIKTSLEKLGCEIYETDLSERALYPDDIKKLTKNDNGIDITYRETLDPNHDNYYDWLSYEIINQKPEYCFIPFGTGDLFINVLNIVKKEYFNSFLKKHDPRFLNKLENLRRCNFIAATTKYKETKLDKLFSSFLPSFDAYIKFVNELRSYPCIGNESSINEIDERYINEAIPIAESQNITFEPSGIAGIAMLLQMKDMIPSDKKILIVNTGKTKTVDKLINVCP